MDGGASRQGMDPLGARLLVAATVTFGYGDETGDMGRRGVPPCRVGVVDEEDRDRDTEEGDRH